MKKHTIGEWALALRPWSLPASAMPIIATLAYLFFKGSEINWIYGIWALVGMILFHLTGNTWSDYFDYRKKVDADDTFGSKSITGGMFAAEEIKNLAISLLVVSTICGLGLLAFTGIKLLWFGVAGVILTLMYPALKYNALGDLDILLAFAFLPVLGTSYAVTGSVDWNCLFVALPVGLITDGILHSNNSRDILTDKRAGIATMAMKIGKKASAWMYGFEMIFPYLWIGVLAIIGIMPVHAIIVFLTIPVAVGCVKLMMNSVEGGSTLIADLDARTAKLQLMFSTLLSIAFVVAKFLK